MTKEQMLSGALARRKEKRASIAKLAYELSDAIHAYNMAQEIGTRDETAYVNMAHSIADHFDDAGENPFHPESPEGREWEMNHG